MARRPSLEERLAKLSELRQDPTSETTRDELRRNLRGKNPHLAAKAAGLVGDFGLGELVPELVAAFDRFLVNPAKTDKGCFAKTAIIHALYTMEEPEAETFRRGMHHVQFEPAYGGPVDTAAEMRATSALGLANTTDPHVVLELVDLLVDRERTVRLATVEALACCGRIEAEALLRLKARHGDEEPDVVTECFRALLGLEPERSLDFVAGYLDSGDLSRREAAALALGASRQEAAFEVLRSQWEKSIEPDYRKTLLIALAMLRREAAFEFLLSLVTHAEPERAAQAITALAVHRRDPQVRQRLQDALSGRAPSARLRTLFEREFPG